MKITITGASGLIGRRLMRTLTGAGHTLQVLSRHAGMNMPGGVKVFAWDPQRTPPEEALRDADAVVHLAGEPVAQRWTAEAKRRIHSSRVEGTRHLVKALSTLSTRPSVLVSSSATGYYGSRGDEILDESSAPGQGFLADVCQAWEQEARAAESFGVRVVCVRTGMVLDSRGGALRQMLLPFQMGVGGRVASGRQWISWIHAQDLAELYRFAVESPLSGPLNGVAPEPVTNADFTRALAAALHRPAIFPMPAFGLKLIFGEMASVLLDSQRAVPRAAEAAGFRFQFPRIDAALNALL